MAQTCDACMKHVRIKKTRSCEPESRRKSGESMVEDASDVSCSLGWRCSMWWYFCWLAHLYTQLVFQFCHSQKHCYPQHPTDTQGFMSQFNCDDSTRFTFFPSTKPIMHVSCLRATPFCQICISSAFSCTNQTFFWSLLFSRYKGELSSQLFWLRA